MSAEPAEHSGIPPISVLVLTKNEEHDLPGCLQSVRWCDDVHVYDSMSTDRTVEIARQGGANVVQRSFDDWSTHQNWGLHNIKFKYPWVLYLDADERATASLVSNMRDSLPNVSSVVAFRIRRRDFFMNRWLKHVQASPYYIRLFKPEKISYQRLVNPITIVDGAIGELGGFLDHYPFSKGMSHWIQKHDSYSTLEAREIVKNRAEGITASLTTAFLSKDIDQRRIHQKRIFYKLPMRPVIKFFVLYFVKRGFLDGHPGMVYAILQSFYEYLIVLKVR